MLPPTRRTALRGLLGVAGAGSLAGSLVGCSTPWGELRVQPLAGDPEPAPLPPDADELARRELLGALEALEAAAEGAAAGASAEVAAVLAALPAVLAEQRAALGPAEPSGQDGAAGSPLPEAFVACAADALTHLEEVSGPMARLVAAVAAGHRATAVALGGAVPEATAAPPAGPLDAAVEAELEAALEAALEAEGAAVYGYGVAAVHLVDPALGEALTRLAVHRTAADAVAAELTGGDGEAQHPAGAYALPFPVADSASALELAVRLEDGTADGWADLVAALPRGRRAGAAAALTDRALGAAAWRRQLGRGGQLRALPGLSGRG